MWDTNEDLFNEIDDVEQEIVETQEETVEPVEELTSITFEDLDDVGEETVEESGEQVEKEVSTGNPYKSFAEYQAEKYGVDISEVKDWDEETYSALIDKIDEIRLEEKYGQLKTSNPFAEAILDVLEAEGDTSDLIDLFKDQREFSEMDSSTVEGKLEKIRKYYRDVKNQPADWVNRHIKRISLGDDDSEIEEEYNFISQQHDEYVKETAKQKVEEAQYIKQQKEIKLKKQIESFSTNLSEQKYNKTDTQAMVDFVYKNKYTIRGTNEQLSEFDVAIAQTKNNPKALTELASYLKDPEKFKQKLALKTNNEKAEKKFVQINDKQPQNNKSITKFSFKS